MSNRKHFAVVTLLVIISTVVVFYVLSAIYQLPRPASAEAVPIDQMFAGHFFMIAFLFSLVMVFILYSSIVFRRRAGDESEGVYFHGHTGLEIAWTLFPLIAVAGFSVWGAQILGQVTNFRDGESVMVVNVTAQKWSWSFSYPEYEDVGPSRELVLPVNQVVRLEMNSPDIIHSFWVPEFRVKQDVVPGMTTVLRITPTEVGEFKVLCAELCGFGHADMRATVRVLSATDYDNWRAEQDVALANFTPVERGEKWVAEFGCVACHTIDGRDSLGPTWQGLMGPERSFTDGTSAIADDAYIHESILDPNARIIAGFPPNVMPQNYGELFEARQAEVMEREGIEIDIIDDLIAYMRTLTE